MGTLERTIVYLVMVHVTFANVIQPIGSSRANKSTHHKYALVKWRWHELYVPLTLSIWVLVAAYAKIVFRWSSHVSEYVPDSALLIGLGLCLGTLLRLIAVPNEHLQLSSHVFFWFLLPPIVFDAGYFLPNRAFFENLGSILVYAIIGTLWNIGTIAAGLYVLNEFSLFSMDLSMLHILLFAAVVSAVDPVAVISVFEEIHVNQILYIVVFGESLLNDAVTVALYNMFSDYSKMNTIAAIDIVYGVLSFFIVSLGGVCIGLCFAACGALTTRYTTKAKLLNPLFVFLVPYLAYLSAELVGMSSILATVTCALVMKPYVKDNMEYNASVAVKYMSKTLSACSEAVIFMFLGLSTVSAEHYLDFAFIMSSIVLCFVCRVTGVILQTFFLNKTRIRKFSNVDQVIMAYSGLRGAVAYGLVVAIDEQAASEDTRMMFASTVELIIIFTVFVQGTTIKPLVNWLKVEKTDGREMTTHEEIFDRLAENTLAGLEQIADVRGDYWMRETFERINQRYLRRVFVRGSKSGGSTANMSIVKSYNNLRRLELLQAAQRGNTLYGRPNLNLKEHTNDAFENETEESQEPKVHFGLGPVAGDKACKQQTSLSLALKPTAKSQMMKRQVSQLSRQNIDEEDQAIATNISNIAIDDFLDVRIEL